MHTRGNFSLLERLDIFELKKNCETVMGTWKAVLSLVEEFCAMIVIKGAVAGNWFVWTCGKCSRSCI